MGHVIECLGLGRRDIADGLQEPPVVEPVHPFDGGEFHGLQRPPRAAPVNDRGLVEAVDALGQGVVVAIADAVSIRLGAYARLCPSPRFVGVWMGVR